MSGIVISPPGAGTASSDVAGSQTFPHEYGYTGWSTWYRLTAYPNAGYDFLYWEITYRICEPGTVDTEKTEQLTGNPVTGSSGWWSSLNEFEVIYATGERYSQSIVSIVAVFRADSYTVRTSVVPQRAGRSTGDGTYLRGSSCTIAATPKCSPWKFDRWEVNIAGNTHVTRSNPYTFSVSGQAICYAYFTHTNTGLPYFDADGNGSIIQRSGEILYDGDAV